MNRTIKFRAWDKENKRIVSDLSLSSLQFYGDSLNDALSHTTVMQSTGLTDKNGKEIFCGDVVKRTTFTRDGEEQMTSIGEVVYKAPSFGMKLAEYKDWVEPLTDGEFQETGYDGMGTEVDFKYEVIGNMFENDNLLKESK